MKKTLSAILMFALLAGQLGWLAYNYHARRVELATAPTLTIACDALDPRDLFRGDYVSFDCEIKRPLTDPLFEQVLHWDEIKPNVDDDGMVRFWRADRVSVPAEQVKTIPARAAQHPQSIKIEGSYDRHDVAVFWQVGEQGVASPVRVVPRNSAEDVARPGEIRTPMELSYERNIAGSEETGYYMQADVSLEMCKSDTDSSNYFRFYVPEKCGEPQRAWREWQKDKSPYEEGFMPFPTSEIQTSVEFVCRGRNGLMVKQVYMNGVPWVEAIEQLRVGKIPAKP